MFYVRLAVFVYCESNVDYAASWAGGGESPFLICVRLAEIFKPMLQLGLNVIIAGYWY